MQYLHTMVRVSDVDRSLDFYCGKLGMKEVRRYENEGGRFTLIFLAAPSDVELAAERKAPLLELTHNYGEEGRGLTQSPLLQIEGVRRSNFEEIGGRAPVRVRKYGILARSGSYGVLAKTS